MGDISKFGFAFFDEVKNDGHLHFVASKPNEKDVLVLNFTSSCPPKQDPSICVFPRGEHQWLTEERSWIAWSFAKVIPSATLRVWASDGSITPHADNVSHSILMKVWDVARDADMLRRGKKLLAEQKIIEPVAYV